MRPVCVLLVVCMAGCDARERHVPESSSIWVEGGEEVGLEVVGAVGMAPHSSWVRSVNAFGAAVGGSPTTVTVNGLPRPISFDALGYAEIAYDAVGLSQVTSGTSTATVYTHGASYEPPGLAPVQAAPTAVTGLATRVTGGAVGVSNDEVWWADSQGLQSHRVLVADAAILGLKALHADVDDQLDVLVWTTTTAYLLRGRVGGGMSWGGALKAQGYDVGGVGLGDLSGDNIPDIAIAWSGRGGNPGLLEVWHGDGLFGFVRTEPRTLTSKPLSLSVADSTGEGQPQVTVMNADGTWLRYIEGAPGRTMPIGPGTPKSIAPEPGSVLLEPFDINGDGLSEIPVGTPFNLTGPRTYLIYDLGDFGLAALPLENDAAPYAGVGDGDGDLVKDFWLHRNDGVVQTVHFNKLPALGEPSYPRKTTLMFTPGPGPIDIEDLDGDGENDVWIASESLWWGIRGRGIIFDKARFWEPKGADDTFVREGINGPFRFVELDGGAASYEVVAGVIDAGVLELVVLQGLRDDERAERIGRVDLAGSRLVDLEVCGKTAYALTSSSLFAVNLTNPLAPVVSARQDLADPRDVTCGTGPSGAVAAVAANNEVIAYGAALNEISRTASQAYGVALSSTQVLACTTTDCAIAPWVLSTGSEGQLVADSEGVTWVDALGVPTFLGGRGDSLQLIDLDQDGVLDMVTHDQATGVIGLYREVGGTVSPPYLWQTALRSMGGIGFIDADLDGFLNLFIVDDEGALRYTHAPRDVVDSTATSTTASHTGETGDTGLAR